MVEMASIGFDAVYLDPPEPINASFVGPSVDMRNYRDVAFQIVWTNVANDLDGTMRLQISNDGSVWVQHVESDVIIAAGVDPQGEKSHIWEVDEVTARFVRFQWVRAAGGAVGETASGSVTRKTA